MATQTFTDKEIKELIHKHVHELLEIEFIEDKEFATRALVRAFHAILRNQRRDIFMDDLLNYVESKDDQKRVY
jgi:hypothetical protein